MLGPCCCTTSNPGVAYYLGGLSSLGNGQKLTFATEVMSANSASLQPHVGRERQFAEPDPVGQKGYISGGYSGVPANPALTSSERQDFTTDVNSAITTAVLTVQRAAGCSLNERSTKSYVLGGITGI